LPKNRESEARSATEGEKGEKKKKKKKAPRGILSVDRICVKGGGKKGRSRRSSRAQCRCVNANKCANKEKGERKKGKKKKGGCPAVSAAMPEKER